MLRLRVYRLALPITILGVEVWAVLTIGLGTILSLNLFDKILPAFLSLPASALAGWLFLKLVQLVKHFFPGRSLVHSLLWITQGDRYRALRETRPMPLVVPREDRFLVKPRPPGATPAKARPAPRPAPR